MLTKALDIIVYAVLKTVGHVGATIVLTYQGAEKIVVKMELETIQFVG